MHMMNGVLQLLLGKCIQMYLDDIIVYLQMWKEHLQHVWNILQLLHKNQLFAKRKKCNFGQRHIDYLGHVITEHGIQMQEPKVEVIQNWSELRSTKDIQWFLGFTGFYHKLNL